MTRVARPSNDESVDQRRERDTCKARSAGQIDDCDAETTAGGERRDADGTRARTLEAKRERTRRGTTSSFYEIFMEIL